MTGYGCRPTHLLASRIPPSAEQRGTEDTFPIDGRPGGRHGNHEGNTQRRRHRQRSPRQRTTSTPSIDEGASVTPQRFFTIPDRDPFDEIEWESRHALIPGKDGPAFDQKDVEFPRFWSQTATNIVAQKYFRGRMTSPERERSVKQMVGRVVDTIGGWGRQGGYFATDDEAETFEAELKAILVNQIASFNSPVWFNVGFEEKPQCSACFILSIDDSMDSILDWIRREGVIFRGGSGSGINLSRLRSSQEQLSKGGYASGPVSFMRGADASAGTIKSGGKTRRAAKMVVLDIDHPDVDEFIWCKAKEERKARVLEQAGYDMSLDSPDWGSIQYQNANNSVRVTDAFMEAVVEGKEWNLTARTDGSVVRTVDARSLLKDIAEASWQCADPGVQYDTTINAVAHESEHGPDQRVEPVLRVHACRRLGLQPLVTQPDEVPQGRRRVRRADVRARRRRDVPRAGDHRRLLVVPDARDQPQRAQVPPARSRLRQPRCPADGTRPPVRLRRGSRLCGGDHRDHDRTRVPQVGRGREAHGPARRLRGERSGDARRDLQAPGGRREHPAHRLGAGGDAVGGAQGLGRRARPGRGRGLPQRAGDRARADRLPRRRQSRLDEPRPRAPALRSATPSGRSGRTSTSRSRPTKGRARRRSSTSTASSRSSRSRPAAATASRARRRTGSRSSTRAASGSGAASPRSATAIACRSSSTAWWASLSMFSCRRSASSTGRRISALTCPSR